jgi:hypothetical protein
MARGKKESIRVDLTRTLELLKEHITRAICGAAFEKVRTNQRQRHWSLFALVRFWVAVVLRAPTSLSHALVEAREGRELLAEPVETTDEAFFQRCRDLSWEFFAEVFRRFVDGLIKVIQPRYRRELSGLQERFTDVLIIDGSRLAAMTRKLKILWNERAVVLPGCLIGVYDLFRGIPRVLSFCADAAASESKRAIAVLGKVKRGTLIVGDRLYCTAKFFQELRRKRLFGVSRRNKRLGLRRVKRLRKRRYRGGLLSEYLVEAGSGQTAAKQELRLIRFQKSRTVHELLTNVLDAKRLTAEEALDLYPARWTVERMFFDLKVVLNLNRFYPANPNAVGMQVYAAAIVYAAMRAAQAEVAEKAGVAPEEISPAKFFPKMAAACHGYVQVTWAVDEMIRLNPRKRLRKPRLKGRRFTTVRVEDILVNPRNGRRRKRRFCRARRKWKSLSHVRGGRKLT